MCSGPHIDPRKWFFLHERVCQLSAPSPSTWRSVTETERGRSSHPPLQIRRVCARITLGRWRHSRKNFLVANLLTSQPPHTQEGRLGDRGGPGAAVGSGGSAFGMTDEPPLERVSAAQTAAAGGAVWCGLGESSINQL